MKEPLKNYTHAEYMELNNTGMLFELYPDATGNYWDDCGRQKTLDNWANCDNLPVTEEEDDFCMNVLGHLQMDGDYNDESGC